MKILVVTPRYYPETFSITNICEGLTKLGNEVTVITGRPHYGLNRIYDGYEHIFDEKINDVTIHRVKEKIRKTGTFSLIKNYLSIYFQFKKCLKHLDGQYDIVLSHTLSPIFAISYVGKYCKKHNIKHIHYGLDLWPESFQATNYLKFGNFIFKLLKPLCKKIYKTCDAISFSSPCAEKYFHDYLKVDVPFHHIYQPCLTSIPNQEIIDNHKYCLGHKLHILYCGTIGKFHHLDLFIKALNSLDIKDKVIVDIVGSGSECLNIQKIVVELGLNEVVKFYGRIPSSETIKYYVNADVIFIPLYKNSFTSNLIPQKVIESLMYGRPILGMITGDGKDIILKASDKNVICNQTVQSIGTSILELSMYSSEKLRKCGNENRTFFISNPNFKIETICEQINSLLNNFSKK